MQSRILLQVLVLATLCRAAFAASEVQTFLQTAISPDGARVAWVQNIEVEGGASAGSVIYVQELKSSAKPQRISGAKTGKQAYEDTIAWSPDSHHLAFLSDAETPGQPQLFVANVVDGSARKVTSLTGSLASPSWSPDAKRVAFLFTENAPQANPLLPMAPETGVISDNVYEQRLTLVDLASGKVEQVSPADMYVYEYDWSPDGKSVALTAAHGAGDANWYVAAVYTLPAAGGAMKQIYKPKLQIAVPRWSPDGKSIAFIEGLMSDQGFTGGDIFVAASGGGSARDVTPNIAASPSDIYWRDPQKILFAENVEGQAGVSTLTTVDGGISSLWTSEGTVTNAFWGTTSLSVAADGRTVAAIQSSWDHPPEIWAGPLGAWQQISHANQSLHRSWGELKDIHWSSDGMNIQGWLLYPRDYDSSRRYPMVTVVHGGPAISEHVGWPKGFFNTAELSDRGYFVFYPNPRGSLGEGERFTEGNVKDFGGGDFRDIMAGVDEIVKTLPVDNDRVGITGWSYGGYMTMWAVTQTNRFHAAVAGAGLANWQSYYGENDIDEWMIPYFGASVYDDPAVYAKSAPMNFIKNVKTPTLVVVGERDGECPAPQSREFWHALKTLGVETELVIYANEGHVFNQPAHQRDVMQRTIAWFDHHLKPSGK